MLLLTEEGSKEWLKSSSEIRAQSFLQTFGTTVYALDGNSIEKALVERLKERKLTISVAESFTGGGIAKRITSVAGASAVYFEGINAYNERAKEKRLCVSTHTLSEKGAVSKETALEMALGLLSTGDCDLAVATTGLAGPNSDASGKPIGLCYIAVGTKADVQVYRYVFNGTREDIAEEAIEYALYHAYEAVQD